MNKQKINIAYQVAGKFKLVATKPDGTSRVLADWFDNLILDAGLNRMGTGNFLTHAFVGTNNTPPATGQTALVAQVASTNTIQAGTSGYDSVGNAYVWTRNQFRFAVGTAAGNLAEVGVGWSTGLYSRALIKDSGGTPTTVTVLSDEYLDVIYEWRVYLPTSDITFNINISGVDYSCVMRPSNISTNTASADWNLYNLTNAAGGVRVTNNPFAYTGDIAAVTAEPSGFSGTGDGNTVAYVNNSYEKGLTCTFGLTQVLSAIKSVRLRSTLGSWQCSFTPTIPKTGSNVLTINWKMSWSRKTL